MLTLLLVTLYVHVCDRGQTESFKISENTRKTFQELKDSLLKITVKGCEDTYYSQLK